MNGGVINESDEVFEDPETKRKISSFELLLNKKVYQVIPEEEDQFELLVEEFKKMIMFPKPDKEYGRKMVKGAVTVVKLPWKLVSKCKFLLAW